MSLEIAKERHRTAGRNDACPCGSGKKYKKCHQLEDDALISAELKRLEVEAAEAAAKAAAEEEAENKADPKKAAANAKIAKQRVRVAPGESPRTGPGGSRSQSLPRRGAV
jgi:septal ring factor EnvC (AmiA/AmiB activator)